MKKIYFYIMIIILFFVFIIYAPIYIQKQPSKYNVIHFNQQGLIQTISSYIIIPLVDSRIDFYLKNSGIITHLQKNKYDNRLIEKEDIKEGIGQKTLCGQEIIIDLEEISSTGIKQKTKNKQIKIGTDKIQALNIGLIGMQEGGERNIKIPSDISERLTGKINKSIMYNVKLKKILSHHPESTKDLLIFDQIIGNKKAIMCGENVDLKYIEKDKAGKQIKEDSIKFKIGEGKAPLAFELGIIEMVPGSKRTIISPPDLLGENFPKDTISILDFSVN